MKRTTKITAASGLALVLTAGIATVAIAQPDDPNPPAIVTTQPGDTNAPANHQAR